MNTPDRQQDSFRYDPGEVAAIGERFRIEPVEPAAIADRLDDGEALVTTDVPEHLGRPIASDADTSIALYRLVQLFGTPNVPGLEAGADQPQREKRTWQYLFAVTYRPEGETTESDGAETFLASVYDYGTSLSVGVSAWQPAEGDEVIPEPSAEPIDGELPGEDVLEALVKLVLSSVEHAVEATYEDLHV